MSTADNKYYLPNDELEAAVESLTIYSNTLLFEFAKHSDEIKDIIIRDFIARGIVLLRSITYLWTKKCYSDANILSRSLVDRLIHLIYLVDTNTFTEYKEWSFVKQYEQRNRARSIPEFRDSLNLSEWKDTEEEKSKYSEYKNRNLQWKRPNPEEIMKNRGLGFLYTLGYDYGSMHVHPMADDGLEEFKLLTNVEEVQSQEDQRSMINNSCLILSMIIQEGFNAGTLNWRKICYDFLDDIREHLSSGSDNYKICFLKIGKLLENGEALCCEGNQKI